jgi:hypothetical protein
LRINEKLSPRFNGGTGLGGQAIAIDSYRPAEKSQIQLRELAQIILTSPEIASLKKEARILRS